MPVCVCVQETLRKSEAEKESMNHKLSYSHVYFTVNVCVPKGKSGECSDFFVNVSGNCAYTRPGFFHTFLSIELV